MKELSIAKFDEGSVNEDAIKATEKWIAVSDGAGGGGVFADRWSKYLVEHLPEKPIKNFKSFDRWLDSIWEPFYNECEERAKQEGGMLLSKFYDEGSFATLVAVWKNGQWISYGDSVAFCYDRSTRKLQHTFGSLVDFNYPPFLVNCKDPTDKVGFKCGKFKVNKDSLIFAASDALAHYILMMYEVSYKNEFKEELQEVINVQSKNSNFINVAMTMKKVDFETNIIEKLLNCRSFKQHLRSLKKKGVVAHDDYSLVIM